MLLSLRTTVERQACTDYPGVGSPVRLLSPEPLVWFWRTPKFTRASKVNRTHPTLASALLQIDLDPATTLNFVLCSSTSDTGAIIAVNRSSRALRILH